MYTVLYTCIHVFMLLAYVYTHTYIIYMYMYIWICFGRDGERSHVVRSPPLGRWASLGASRLGSSRNWARGRQLGMNTYIYMYVCMYISIYIYIY